MSVYPISSNAHYLSRRSMGQQSHTKVKATSVLPRAEEALPRWRETNRPADYLIARKVGASGDTSPSHEQSGPKLRRRDPAKPSSDSAYFPFGRPGNGAPLIDPVERFKGQQVPAAQGPTSARMEVEQRNKRQQAVRHMLDEQLEEKRWRQSEEERRKEQEDRLEEERVERQRRELEEEYRRELLSREGLSPPPPAEPLRRPPVRQQRPNPSPGPYFSSFGRKARYTKEDKPEVFPRERALEDVITQMKAASLMQSEHTQEVLLDFERMRAELHRVDRRMWERPYEFGKLQQDSRFLPLSNAGKAVVAQPVRVPSSLVLPAPDIKVQKGEVPRAESVVAKGKTWEDSMEGDKDVEMSLGILHTKFDVEESAKFSEP